MRPQHIDPAPREPIDPDVALRSSAQAASTRWAGDPVLLSVIAAGGAIGSAARYLIGQAWPASPGGFPWATLLTNVTGCALIGVLMVLVTELWTEQRHLRPFLGTGVLGGFTTFSAYTVDIQRLISGGQATTGLIYLFTTLTGALLAVWLSTTTTRVVVDRSTRPTRSTRGAR